MTLKPDEVSEIIAKIEAEISKTQVTVIKFRELTKPISPENAIGRVSRMDAINNKTINDSALQNAETKLKHLTIALTQIDEPDFGLCRICKIEIPFGRILLMPQANTCLQCASRF